MRFRPCAWLARSTVSHRWTTGSRMVSAAATNQSRSVAADASLPSSSASLASTALLISSSSPLSAGAMAGRSPPSAWFAFAGGGLRAKLGLSMPHASCAGIGAWPAPRGHRVPSRFQNLDSCVPIMGLHVEQGLRGPSMTGAAAGASDILPLLPPTRADRATGGSRHGARRRLAQQGGGVSREGTCRQRSATCSASPPAGAQLSQVRRGDGSATVERSPLAVQKPVHFDLRRLPQGAAFGGGCLSLPPRRRLGAGRCLDEIVNDAGILPRRNFAVQSCGFLPPFGRVLGAHHHCLPRTRIDNVLSYHNRGKIMYAV